MAITQKTIKTVEHMLVLLKEYWELENDANKQQDTPIQDTGNAQDIAKAIEDGEVALLALKGGW